MHFFPIIIVKALTPLMLLSLALAIAAFVTALTRKSKRWIPIVCGVAYLALAAAQLVLWSVRQHELLGTMGMGKPEALAEIVWRFLAVVFVTPIIAPFALCGTAIAAFKRVLIRVLFVVLTLATLVTANALTTRSFDWNLSTSLADGRWEREDKLWIIQRDTYVETLKQGGVSVDPDQINYNDLLPPREVHEDTSRDDFFEDHPPASILKALLTDTFNEWSKANSKMLDREILEKHRAACEEEGRRLARDKLERGLTD